MPYKRCHHGDDAPRYANRVCKICAKERATRRKATLRQSQPEEYKQYLRDYMRHYRQRRRDGIQCPCGKNLLLLAPTVAPHNVRSAQPSLYCSPECRAYYTYQTCVSLVRDGWRVPEDGHGDDPAPWAGAIATLRRVP